MIRDAVLGAILAERINQDEKWGWPRSDLSYSDWLAILAEEFGEAAEAVVELRAGEQLRLGSHQIVWKNQLQKELIQVAAVAISILESMEERDE